MNNNPRTLIKIEAGMGRDGSPIFFFFNLVCSVMSPLAVSLPVLTSLMAK